MNFKKIISLVFVAAFCVTMFSACGEATAPSTTNTTTQSTTSASKTIALVGQNSDDAFWQAVKKGADEAAKKYGYTVTLANAEDATKIDAATHTKSLENALNNGVAGVIVMPVGKGYSTIFTKLYDAKIPVVQIDSLTQDDLESLESASKNPIVSTISTSYEKAGAGCAEKLYNAVKDDIKGSTETYVVGVIQRDDSDADKLKAKGFKEKFTEFADASEETKGKYKIETEEAEDYSDALVSLKDDNAKSVFITHKDIADNIADTVAAQTEPYKGIVFCGFDSGAKQVKWLSAENTNFIGGVAQNAYDIGYNAAEQCVFAVQGKDVKPTVEIEAQWYDIDNLDKMKQDNIVFEK